MLRIEKRTATFGANLNVRTECHGDDKVLGIDVPVKLEVPRGRDLANLLIGENAEHLLWVEERGEMIPRYAGIKPIGLADKIESARVEIWPRGLDDDTLVLPDASLKSVKVKPVAGGRIELSFTLQATPEGDDYTKLVDCLNRDVELKLDCKGFRAQQRLALSQPDEAVTPAEPAPVNGSDESPAPRRRRRPAQLDA
jgi:hypothetical protein